MLAVLRTLVERYFRLTHWTGGGTLDVSLRYYQVLLVCT